MDDSTLGQTVEVIGIRIVDENIILLALYDPNQKLVFLGNITM